MYVDVALKFNRNFQFSSVGTTSFEKSGFLATKQNTSCHFTSLTYDGKMENLLIS